MLPPGSEEQTEKDDELLENNKDLEDQDQEQEEQKLQRQVQMQMAKIHFLLLAIYQSHQIVQIYLNLMQMQKYLKN